MSLGAYYKEGVSTFRVFSNSAPQIDLILFEADNTQHPVQKLSMQRQLDGTFSVSVKEDLDGLLYGYQVNDIKKKFFLDPYAVEVGQEYSNGAPALGLLRFPSTFDWQGVKKPNIKYSETIIYEGHVKGLTKLHSSVVQSEQGTFLGLCAPEFIKHLKNLGVTALELLPICYHLDEKFLTDVGLVNYWGYNPINYFALSPRLASRTSPLSINHQFKAAVRELHRAGIEVILDVVFNHTGEGTIQNGRAVSLRGLDPETYYRVDDNGDIDYTGCGNTLNTDNPRVVKLICDSLRYFADEMQVDGFRFDLASALARTGRQFNRNHPLLVAISQDPILSEVKLIAEPWDATFEGYQLGQFGRGWREWNDKYRDVTRRFWRGDSGTLGQFASALAGSSNFFGGPATRSINFITAHDGFTLHDLVSYSQKRNLENAQNGLDGANQNYSFNCGFEGDSNDSAVLELRLRMQKNLLATLLLSKGIPMILGGDELGRTQLGNNNAYCHDVAWNYLNWESSDTLNEWIKELVGLRRIMLEITSEEFFLDRDVVWLTENGSELVGSDWNTEETNPLVLRVKSKQEQRDLLLVFNPTDKELTLGVPNLELILASTPVKFKSPFILVEKSFAAFRVNTGH